MAEMQGLTALAGYQVHVDPNPEATPEQRYGGTADPRHGDTRTDPSQYPSRSKLTQAGAEHGPYGQQNQLLDNPDDWLFFPAGDESQDPTIDRTPSTHAAPWPMGIMSGPIDGYSPDAVAEMRLKSHLIHSTDKGAGLKALTGLPPVQDTWVEVDNVTAGHSEQTPLPRQAMSSGFMFGTTDRVQSMARQNEFGFDSAHMHRRIATGAIPGNTMWMRPGGRPIRKTLASPARPAVGPTSPFGGQDLGYAFGPDGAVLQNVPMEYVAPPSPTLAQAPAPAQDYGDAVVEWW